MIFGIGQAPGAGVEVHPTDHSEGVAVCPPALRLIRPTKARRA